MNSIIYRISLIDDFNQMNQKNNQMSFIGKLNEKFSCFQWGSRIIIQTRSKKLFVFELHQVIAKTGMIGVALQVFIMLLADQVKRMLKNLLNDFVQFLVRANLRVLSFSF